MRQRELKSRVERILRDYPKARDSDVWLTIKLWTIYHPTRIQGGEIESADGVTIPAGKKYIYLLDILDLPSEDKISRHRRFFQNTLKKYLPTSWEVAKTRKIKEKEWREYINSQTEHLRI